MKNWTRPEVSELEVSLTANGFFPCNKERWIITDDSKAPIIDPDDDNDKDKTEES